MAHGKGNTLRAVSEDMDIPPEKTSRPDVGYVPEKRHEVVGVIGVLGSLFLLLSLLSYAGQGSDGAGAVSANWMGITGDSVAYLSAGLLGYVAYLLNGFLWIGSINMFRRREEGAWIPGLLGMGLILVFSSVVVHTALRGSTAFTSHLPGGVSGELIGEFMISILSTAGTYLMSIGGILIVLLLITNVSLFLVLRAIGIISKGLFFKAWGAAKQVYGAWRESDRLAAEDTEEAPVVSGKSTGNAEKSSEEGKLVKFKAPVKAAAPNPEKEAPKESPPAVTESSTGDIKIVTTKQPNKTASAKKEPAPLVIDRAPLEGTFRLPPVEFLESPPPEAQHTEVDEAHLKSVADQLVRILSDFGVYGEVREIHPGPVVTMFEFQPKSGTKLSKIESLSNEIAMALEVIRVRVVAPIPGKNAVGFELPNRDRETVYLKEMITDESFQGTRSKLPLALGKDTAGIPYFVDLAKMPHLLIAGTTGSGKSVSLNAMLLSLLYKYTPEDLRFLMIDPKMIELGIYDGIPHLLLPVVTDMSKACLALKWAVDEMERRYQMFADVSVRNLAAYNAKIEKLKSDNGSVSDLFKPAPNEYSVEEGEVVIVSEASKRPDKLEKMPFVVVVVDELADLMMVAAKDVETSIARLAQKARAAGIHLIIATQRPSVDVITGLIKANFPSRISFRVSSGHDSRTILGTYGAENLLGMGDMLIMPPGTSDLVRVHGAYVEDDDIHKIVNFLKAQGAPMYDEAILRPRDDDDAAGVNEEEKDEVYDQAVAIVAESQLCSISLLQRKLRIGYNRSARIVEIMEKEGIVGSANGVNKREVLISPH